jgi:hypothetical protein
MDHGVERAGHGAPERLAVADIDLQQRVSGAPDLLPDVPSLCFLGVVSVEVVDRRHAPTLVE